ncbi:MAG: tRNA lysidine(34) synthetase TilS [Nitrospinales bacterium]
MNSFDAKVLEHINNSKMFVNGDYVLIAVSGGADSIALLNLLVSLRKELKIDLAIGHLNHSARGIESDEDASFVSKLGKSMGITTFVEKIDVSKEKKNLKTSFQESGRILRQKFLESTLGEIGGNKIALGHIADDQVETFLINLLRGSGLKGLGGMSENNGLYVRPLLNCFKNEIHEYLESQNLPHRFDKSNAKKDYLRNRIRLDLIPNIQKDFNPKFKESLLTTINIIRDEEKYLADSMESIFKDVSLPNTVVDESLKIEIPKVLGYPLSMKRRIIRHAICLVKGNLRSYTYWHIQSLIKLMENGISGKKIDLPSGLVGVINDNYLKIYQISGSRRSIIHIEPEKNIYVSLNIPGETWVSGSPLKFTSNIVLGSDRNSLLPNSSEADLDFEKTGRNIVIRYPQKGDVFNPLGMLGSKTLKAFFVDTKTPREDRNKIPILTTASNEIIWVFGKRISNAFRVTSKTKNILHIQGDM